jgi:hypothetical protein
MRALFPRRPLVALAAALSLGAAACGGRQVEVRTGEAPASAESSISFTNNMAQAVNVYVTPASGTGEIFLKQVPARSSEVIAVRGVSPGTAARLRAAPVDGSVNYSRDNVVLGAGFAWTVP